MPNVRPAGSRYETLRNSVPNMITALSACCGLAAINVAMHQQFQAAALLIMIAAVFDCFDGYAARRLNCASEIGVQLDSLADFLSFGVAPAFVMYLWALDSAPILGFAIATIYVLCCGYRLARFNAEADKPVEKPWLKGFFKGIPAPAAAGCALLPLVLSQASGQQWILSWSFSALVLTGTAIMMVRTTPTFSSKTIMSRLGQGQMIVLIVGMAIALAVNTWMSLSILIGLYILSIPAAVLSVRAARRNFPEQHRLFR